jgi:large subunit ribosomal protein L9
LIQEEDLKVILTEYMEKLGDIGDIVDVRAGFANNYLIPQGIALPATGGNINQMKLVKKAALKVEAKNIEEANEMTEKLKDLTLKFIVKTGEEGKLYGSITNKDLAEKIMEERNIEIDRKKIDLSEHIKELGEYDVDVKLYKEIKSAVKVIVEPDEESRALIEAHKKERETAEEEERQKLDAEIEEEAEKGRAKEKEEKATPAEKDEKPETPGPGETDSTKKKHGKESRKQK